MLHVSSEDQAFCPRCTATLTLAWCTLNDTPPRNMTQLTVNQNFMKNVLASEFVV